MNFKIVGIGEVLWDLLPSGAELGGAPANFACHARALGASATVVTRVGNDSFGQAILGRFAEQGIASGPVQVDDAAPTGTVTVTLSAEGVPSYTILEDSAWDRLVVTPAALRAIHEANAVCFGSLAQRSTLSRTAIQTLVAAAPADALRVFDINLRRHYFSRDLIEQSLRLANVLKLNEDELVVLADLFRLAGTPWEQMERLAQQFALQLVALTRGPAGSLLFQAGQWSDGLAVPIRVADTVGAGDAFTAALVMGLLHKMPLAEINAYAGEVSRFVCTCAGATPPLPKHFSERLAARDGARKTVSQSNATVPAGVFKQ